MSLVWELRLPDSEKLVLLALADAANDEGRCWPSMAALSRKCTKSDRTIQGSIRSLEAKGLLTRNERPGRGVIYTVHPRSDFTPEATSPPKRTTPTPEAISDKPSRTIKTSGSVDPSVRRARPNSDLASRVVEAWNAGPAKAGAMPARGLPKQRLELVRRRAAENGEDAIFEVIDNLASSGFHCGDNDRGWRANLDWVLKPSNFHRTLELAPRLFRGPHGSPAGGELFARLRAGEITEAEFMAERDRLSRATEEPQNPMVRSVLAAHGRASPRFDTRMRDPVLDLISRGIDP